MNWIDRSQPPERDEPPPVDLVGAPVEAPATAVVDAIETERAALRAMVLPRLRTARQARIRERITALTIESLKQRRI